MRDAYTHIAEGPEDGPLLVLLHGTGGDETQFLELARALRPDARRIAPRGDVSEHGAARFFRRRAMGVYDMEDLARATAKLAGFVEAHATGAPEVIGLGYSNGANILASLLFARPNLLDRAVLMHPLIPWTPDPAPVRAQVLITAGVRDEIAPATASEALAAWFRDQGTEVETFWHEGGHSVPQAEIDAVARFLARSAASTA